MRARLDGPVGRRIGDARGAPMAGPIVRAGRARRPLAIIALLAIVPARPVTPADPQPVGPAPWTVGAAVPIAVRDGQSRFDVPTLRAGSKVLVIASALARGPGPFPIKMTASPIDHVEPPNLAVDGLGHSPDLAAPPPRPIPNEPTHLPPQHRTFHLLARDGDPASPSHYRAVVAELRAVGRRVQVYVDRGDTARVGPDVLRDIVATFDGRVFPVAADRLDLATDVDGDGRFTVLLTGTLAHLADGKLTADGFVRGADFDPSLPPPLGNHCDMMYLNANLQAGPYLRTVLAHEYTHAVVFCRKSLAQAVDGRLGPEEEGWLDEALAHLAEDLHGFSRSNLDYRVRAFLDAPERYRLLVDDYYAAGLFRSHGNRGSTYLFLRSCVDRVGPAMLGALVRSPRRGVANLEAASGTPFAALYRNWSAALYLDALKGAGDGPRPSWVVPEGKADASLLAGTSSHFAVIEASPTGAVRVEVTAPRAAELQVTAICLPDDLPRVDVTARLESGPDGSPRLRLDARERDGVPIILDRLSWGPLIPAPAPHASGSRRGVLDGLDLARAFGSATLAGRGALRSGPIVLAGGATTDEPLVIRLNGRDPRGRSVAAWAVVDRSTTVGAGDQAARSIP